MSAEERRLEMPAVPMALEAGPRNDDFDASGVLFLLPMMLLAIFAVGSCLPRCLSWSRGQSPAGLVGVRLGEQSQSVEVGCEFSNSLANGRCRANYCIAVSQWEPVPGRTLRKERRRIGEKQRVSEVLRGDVATPQAKHEKCLKQNHQYKSTV